ncbi:MAG: leucine--tRNA ligase [Flavobacteriales bacterium]|nr:leucine--tRNA ligase [Flavobacteriales bacterium]MCX7768109.1 leucine--tRNA ligase [Flavobacteriales bacterium]MDW8409599.1 leucine--tRNA ligase [Flavobacteriales bacterium]
MEYEPKKIEPRWQEYWEKNKVYRSEEATGRPKYYVLDMFPYPSGAGLHVGHPLGYIASDIVSRYHRHKGFNVLHPMGFDAFGLPAEQYAIQTGRHPAQTTHENITRFIGQLKKLGMDYDWDRMVVTSDPQYYKWTQWLFIQLFHHWYDRKAQRARPIRELEEIFRRQGNFGYHEQLLTGNLEGIEPIFSGREWENFSSLTRASILMNYRLAYQSYAYVNWCEALGTVLANDEVKDGVSERGGHPVERRLMRQWFLRITEYADRLYDDLDALDWPESMKEMQRHWIGRSRGLLLRFPLNKQKEEAIEVFTTRPDTVFGVTFLTLAPENHLWKKITPPAYYPQVEAYCTKAIQKSERERQAEVRQVNGVFTGAFALHPFTGEAIPVWVSEYVLGGYGTGAVMGVPAHDSRDFRFARHYGLPIRQVVMPPDSAENQELTTAYEEKMGTLINSEFINGLDVLQAIEAVIREAERRGVGQQKTNYRLRDANFSRQRYWGEPFPIYYDQDGVAHTLPEDQLPLLLPPLDDFRPTGRPEGPLGKLKEWVHPAPGIRRETDTMPGFAGSSWYFFRYMDPKNQKAFAGREALEYWRQVDLYIGGTEHAVGHLLYARFFTKFLYDIGLSPVNEPFKKLLNQGMILGRSNFVYRLKESNTYVSKNLAPQYDHIRLHVDVNLVHNDVLDIEAFRKAVPDAATAEFILEDGQYICGWEVEKMSKSRLNVVNPDDVIEQYSADTLRMYEMFLGPLEQSKPWSTSGIEGIYRYLKRVAAITEKVDRSKSAPDEKENIILHKTIKAITKDLEQYSFNTCVSHLMIGLNQFYELETLHPDTLATYCVLLSPFAPHLAEEIWHYLGREGSVTHAPWPIYREEWTRDAITPYPVAINGKTRFSLELPADMSPEEVERTVLAHPMAKRWLQDRQPRKVIVVKGRIVNIVV